jgi:hypothetical protein
MLSGYRIIRATALSGVVDAVMFEPAMTRGSHSSLLSPRTKCPCVKRNEKILRHRVPLCSGGHKVLTAVHLSMSLFNKFASWHNVL